jgi:hypothetical protein
MGEAAQEEAAPGGAARGEVAPGGAAPKLVNKALKHILKDQGLSLTGI